MAYIYESEILEAGITNVIPDYAPLTEAYFYLQEATENDWNTFRREIGIHELGILEATGSEVVYEADEEAGESVKDKVVKWIQYIWERIRGLFEKALKSLQDFAGTAKAKFTSAYKNHIAANLKSGKITDEGLKAKVHTTVHSYKGLENATVKTEDFDKEAFVKELQGNTIEVTKNWLMSNGVSTLINGATEFKFTKKQIGTSYTSAKQAVDAKIKEAKASKSAENMDSYKKELTNVNKSASVIVSMYMARQREYAKTLASLAILAGKQVIADKKAEKADKAVEKATEKAAKAKEAANSVGEKKVKEEKEVKESAVMESYSTEIEKLFDWNF